MKKMTEATRLRGLYAITPGELPGERLIEQVDAALRGGATLVQYRDKQRDVTQQAEIARALRALCRQHGARLIVNDDLQLALAVDADGLHLGGSDGDRTAARRALGAGKLLGASCYADFELARQAVAAGADYVAFGAVYPSLTKPGAAVATVDLFFQAKTRLTAAATCSTCAIGGITVTNAPPLIAAGADLLAVITDLFSASGDSAKITARASAYQRLFEEAHA